MNLKRQRLFTYVEVDDKTPIQKLSIKDQLRVLLKRLTYDEASELKSEDAVTINQMQLKADLLDFIQKATEPISKGEHKKVKLSVSNQFDPVLDEVLESKSIVSFYEVVVLRPDIEYDIPYFIHVILEVKNY